jgi:osmotically-inducible protein OsmY
MYVMTAEQRRDFALPTRRSAARRAGRQHWAAIGETKMDNRYRTRQGQHDYRDRYGSQGRQSEQFSSESDWQQGDESWRNQERNQRWQPNGDHERGFDRNENSLRQDFGRSGGGFRSDTSSLDDYDRQGASRYGRQETSHTYFRGDDFGGQDYSRGSHGALRGTGGYGQQQRYGGASSGGHIPQRPYDPDDRGFFDRASDEVMSWFGDEDAARRRKMDSREDHSGRGPANYTRSSEKLQEEACERLTRDRQIDASKITVTCNDNEITLDGTVDSRAAKRRAEDIVDDISGVKHVQNNLRVESRESYYGQTGTSTES